MDGWENRPNSFSTIAMIILPLLITISSISTQQQFVTNSQFRPFLPNSNRLLTSIQSNFQQSNSIGNEQRQLFVRQVSRHQPANQHSTFRSTIRVVNPKINQQIIKNKNPNHRRLQTLTRSQSRNHKKRQKMSSLSSSSWSSVTNQNSNIKTNTNKSIINNGSSNISRRRQQIIQAQQQQQQQQQPRRRITPNQFRAAPLNQIPFGAVQQPTNNPNRNNRQFVTSTASRRRQPNVNNSIPPRARPQLRKPADNGRRRLPATKNTIPKRRTPNSMTSSTAPTTLRRQKSRMIEHQATHKIAIKSTRRLLTNSTTTISKLSNNPQILTKKAAATTTTTSSPFEKIGDIEALILKAIQDSSTTTTSAPLIRSRSRSRLSRPSRKRINSIEQAVLRAVLDTENLMKTAQQQPSLPSEDSESESTTTTTTTTLFPAFAPHRSISRNRRPFSSSSSSSSSSSVHRKISATVTTTTMASTPEMSTETTTTLEPILNETTTAATTTTTTKNPETTTISLAPPPLTTTEIAEIIDPILSTTASINIDLAENDEEIFEDISQGNQPNDDLLQIHQIEQNIIETLNNTTSPQPPTSTILQSSTTSTTASGGPPGFMPPSDEIVDELNDAADFMQVAQRLNILKRLLH